MTTPRSRLLLGVLVALTMVAMAPARAQQPATVPAAAAAEPSALPSASPQSNARPATAAALPPHDLSPWSMFLSADILVKAVMVCLACASLATWTILLAMTIHLSAARRRLRRALAGIGEARTFAEAQLALGPTPSVLALLLAAALDELRISADRPLESGIKERAAMRFSEIVRTEGRLARQGMGLLATIGAVSPFVGLFGTVWGIMNSFIGISKSQTTNLAVVAPGIAEALLATAFGLMAAIPAVIIYNHFARATKNYLELVNRGSGTIGRLLSRDLDRAQTGLMARAAE